jgi:hypothetical protein
VTRVPVPAAGVPHLSPADPEPVPAAGVRRGDRLLHEGAVVTVTGAQCDGDGLAIGWESRDGARSGVIVCPAGSTVYRVRKAR